MSSRLIKLSNQDKIKIPNFIKFGLCYECLMGSQAYGCATETSDEDLYGFCIPTKELLFPHLGGEIFGFDEQQERFNQYQQSYHDEGSKEHYDFHIYNIVKYFRLCLDANPNMIDSLFVPTECITHITTIGQMVLEKKELFLSKKCFHSFIGYAYKQLHKMGGRNVTGKRVALREQYGFDVKFAYHLVRLLDEAEQILLNGTINLRRIKEKLKAIRRGEISEEEIRAIFTEKEKYLTSLYQTSNAVPHDMREKEVKQLLINCIEHHYGSLSKICPQPNKSDEILKQIKQLVSNV